MSYFVVLQGEWGPSAHLGKVLGYQTMLQGLSDLPVSSTHVQPTHLLKATVRIFCLVVVFLKNIACVIWI